MYEYSRENVTANTAMKPLMKPAVLLTTEAATPNAMPLVRPRPLIMLRAQPRRFVPQKLLRPCHLPQTCTS